MYDVVEVVGWYGGVDVDCFVIEVGGVLVFVLVGEYLVGWLVF